MTATVKSMEDLSRNRCVTLERYLYRMHPSKSSSLLSDILQIFFRVDVALYRIVIDWLKGAYGWSKASAMVLSAVREISCPLLLSMSDDGRPCVACSTNVVKHHNGDIVTADTIQVPFTSTNGASSGTVAATIFEGDLVKLRCQSSIIWQVYEINLSLHKIILRVHKRRLMIDRDKCFERCASAKGNARRAKAVPTDEKREFVVAELMGAIVWRGGFVNSINSRAPNCMDDGDMITYDGSGSDVIDPAKNEISSLCVFQMPITPWELVLASMKSLVSGQERLHGSNTETESGPSSVKMSPSGAVPEHKKNRPDDVIPYSESRKTKKEEYSAPMPSTDCGLDSRGHAQAQQWLTKEKNIVRARRLLLSADPFSCCLASCKDRWMLTCRALRAVSGGDESLLEDFYNWTSTAGEEGMVRAKDCKSAWRSLRPLTTADLPCVIKARVYAKVCLHARNSEMIQSQVSMEGGANSISLRSIEVNCITDPTLKSFIKSATSVLSGRSLFFLSSVNDAMTTVYTKCPPGSMLVPAVVYESKQRLNSSDEVNFGMNGNVDNDDDEKEKYMPPNTAADGTKLLNTGKIVASISPGDVVLLPSFDTSSAKHQSRVHQQEATSSSSGRRSTWHRVIAIDLLNARIRVSPCPPPPDCWCPHVTLPSIWAPISSLWAVPVCQLLPPNSPEYDHHVRYIMYVTPILSLAASFSALASLPRKQKEKTIVNTDLLRSEKKEIKKTKQKKRNSDIPVEIKFLSKKTGQVEIIGRVNPPIKHK